LKNISPGAYFGNFTVTFSVTDDSAMQKRYNISRLRLELLEVSPLHWSLSCGTQYYQGSLLCISKLEITDQHMPSTWPYYFKFLATLLSYSKDGTFSEVCLQKFCRTV